MQLSPRSGFQAMLTHVIGDMAKVISERSGESETQRLARHDSAVRMMVDLAPRDAIEAMLASHCVLFHELLVDGVKDAAGEDKPSQTGRGGAGAMNKAFLANLAALRRCQARPAEGERATPEPASPPEPEPAAAPRAPVSSPVSAPVSTPVSVRAAPRAAASVPDAAPAGTPCVLFSARPAPLPAPPSPMLSSALAAQAVVRVEGFRLTVPGGTAPRP